MNLESSALKKRKQAFDSEHRFSAKNVKGFQPHRRVRELKLFLILLTMKIIVPVVFILKTNWALGSKETLITFQVK